MTMIHMHGNFNKVYCLLIVAIIFTSSSSGDFCSEDPLVDTIFCHPKERQYSEIVTTLARKYSEKACLSFEDVVEAYPVTVDEFDYFYKTFNPESRYGNYTAKTLPFFEYVLETIKSAAETGERETLYREFNLLRFIDVKRNLSLNEEWVLDFGYYETVELIGKNWDAILYLINHLDRDFIEEHYSDFVVYSDKFHQWYFIMTDSSEGFRSEDLFVDAIFCHPKERQYQDIVTALAKKYSEKACLSFEDALEAYPVTVDEFDYFYKTFYPGSKYGRTDEPLLFFEYILKTIRSAAETGERETLYRVLNFRRFIDTKRNNLLNEEWILDFSCAETKKLIEKNWDDVRYMLNQLNRDFIEEYYSDFVVYSEKFHRWYYIKTG